MSDRHCEDAAQLIPELALGCLDGRERAAALDHVHHCLHCRQELATYQELASELLDLVPAAAPPAGFEIRALAGMKTPPSPGNARAAGAGAGRRRRAAWAVAAAALIALTGIGGYEFGRFDTPQPPLHTAALTDGGRQIGTAYWYAGARRWIWVAIHLGRKTQDVSCELEPGPGRKAFNVGTFTLASGQGSWGSDVPFPWERGTVAVIRNSANQTIATGTFRS